MAGETIRSEAVCLAIHPWSRTSHVVSWLLPSGPLTTIVKGAERPKSAFLGQYDLNYTCDIVYYARAHGEIHALRECAPIEMRDALRGDYRALALAGYFRSLVEKYATPGTDARSWYDLLKGALDRLSVRRDLSAMLDFEINVLGLLGLEPALEADSGVISLRGERRLPVSGEVARYLHNPLGPTENSHTPLDASRVISVFYTFHLDSNSEVRRTVQRLICNKEGKKT